MSGYLLDTSIVSAFSPTSPNLPGPVAEWFQHQERTKALYLCSIVIAEIATGTQKLARLGVTKRADQLEQWLDRLVLQFATRIIDLDTQIARLSGRMADQATAAGKHPGLADVLIAATAKAHDLTILTANKRHFDVLGVQHRNPFDTSATPN